MITLEQFAAVLAHLEHFPARDHHEVHQRLRVSGVQFRDASTTHGPAMAASAAKGDTSPVKRFSDCYRAAKEELGRTNIPVQQIAPLTDEDFGAEESTEDAPVEMPATVMAPTQLAPTPGVTPVAVPTYLTGDRGMQRPPLFVQVPDPVAPLPVNPDDTLLAIVVKGPALPFSGRISEAEAQARYSTPVTDPSPDAGATQLAPSPLAPRVAEPKQAPGVTGLMSVEAYARLCAALALRGEDDIATVREFGLGTVQSKDAMHRMFALRFQTDPRMKGHFDRLVEEEIRRLRGG